MELHYFDPEEPVAHLAGSLPHWRQRAALYFVTFRLADALPQEKLAQWRSEMALWIQTHPEPYDQTTRREYNERFPARLQRWLDANYGSCVLGLPEVRKLVEQALGHFAGERYLLDEWVVASNHVHVLVEPIGENALSAILHSWKSFTAHRVSKMPGVAQRMGGAVWQKESFDHLVRSPESLDKFRAYIRAHVAHGRP